MAKRSSIKTTVVKPTGSVAAVGSTSGLHASGTKIGRYPSGPDNGMKPVEIGSFAKVLEIAYREPPEGSPLAYVQVKTPVNGLVVKVTGKVGRRYAVEVAHGDASCIEAMKSGEKFMLHPDLLSRLSPLEELAMCSDLPTD